MIEMICINCTYYDQNEMVELGKGLCKRYPPQPIQGNLYKSSFPVVNNQDWCGEFEERK